MKLREPSPIHRNRPQQCDVNHLSLECERGAPHDAEDQWWQCRRRAQPRSRMSDCRSQPRAAQPLQGRALHHRQAC